MLQQETEPKNFQWVAKCILKSQKKLGALKGLKINVLSLSDSRKKYLKQAGLYSVLSIPGSVLGGIMGYKLEKRRLKKKGITVTDEKKFKRDYYTGSIVGGTAIATALGPASKAGISAIRKKQTVVIEAKYAYGTKLFEVCSLSQEELANKVDKKILREVTAEVASLKTAKEWAVKESASVDYLNLAVLGETLIEDILESQLLEDVDVTVAATKAARDVSDFEEVEDDEEVEEGYLFEDEDCEDSDEDELEEACGDSEDSDDEEVEEAYLFEDEDCDDSDEDEEDEDSDDDKEEELDEEVFFETDMFKI